MASSERLLYDWFGNSVPKFADHIALEVAEYQLTYRELDKLVRGLAHDIAAFRVERPVRRVGLLASRSLMAYAGYLAILRLGATPVPLSPAAPAARNAKIAALAGLDLVVRGPEAVRVDPGVAVLDVSEQEVGRLSENAADPPSGKATLDDFAYILFTSGSTGVPKGVPLTHRNISPFIAHVISRYDAGPGARLSQVAELTFDPSVHDMFVAWGTGAALVVPTRGEILSPLEFINGRDITHWFSVPSVISMALRLDELAPGSLPGLRWSLFSGEPLTLQQARAWQAAAPNSAVDNIYGPTELTGCCEYRLTGDPDEWMQTSNGTVPIGQAYPGMEYVITDEHGRAASRGELSMRGTQRFPGYLDPAENEGRFLRFDGDTVAAIRDGESADDAWYRTGDLVEMIGDVMVHLGRLDHQLKILGRRVETGEIEATLRAWPGIHDAVVIAVTGSDGEVHLCAALTGACRDAGEPLAQLARQLPDYMIPTVIAFFDELPLNSNGKTDRKMITEILLARLAAQNNRPIVKVS